MIVISNNVDALGIEYPKGSIIRINTAWVNTLPELKKELQRLEKYRIYLDYPVGRKKPPIPKMTWNEILEVSSRYGNIDYVAWSNAENPESLRNARLDLPERVMLVPKIETIVGVLHLEEIINASRTKLIMIDKEDLATAAKDPELYQHLLEHARKKAEQLGIQSIELKGVIFN